MSIVARDLVLRIIEQLAEALARIAALAQSGRAREALSVIDEAERALLGDQLRELERVDSVQAALMLRDPQKLRGWARLMAERASLFAKVGDTAGAALAARRARALYREAHARGAELGDSDHAALAALETASER